MYMIYGVTDCPHCLRAQALCMEKGVEYVWVMLDWSKECREYIKDRWEWKTYPIVTKLTWIGPPHDPEYTEDLVGGFDELQELLSLGQ